MRIAHRVAWGLSIAAIAGIATAIWYDISALLLRVALGCCLASSLLSLVLFVATKVQTRRWRGALLWPLLVGAGSYVLFFLYALLMVGQLLAKYAD
jgi:hypothetical protein